MPSALERLCRLLHFGHQEHEPSEWMDNSGLLSVGKARNVSHCQARSSVAASSVPVLPSPETTTANLSTRSGGVQGPAFPVHDAEFCPRLFPQPALIGTKEYRSNHR